MKGNVITFPQSVSEIAQCLPLSTNLLPELIKIIFVGSALPSRDQVRKILTVRRESVRTALLWLQANNILYNNIAIDHLLVNNLPMNDVTDSLWNTISIVDQSENNNVERSGYADNEIVPEETNVNGAISLANSGLMDTMGSATSSNDIMRHLITAANVHNDRTTENDNIFLVPHGPHPVNEYFNTAFLPGTLIFGKAFE